jgi:hypothetical protein
MSSAPAEIALTAEQSALTVEGRKAGKDDDGTLHQGISMRSIAACSTCRTGEGVGTGDQNQKIENYAGGLIRDRRAATGAASCPPESCDKSKP